MKVSIIVNIAYFKDLFKRLNFRVFRDDAQLQMFIENIITSENILNALTTERLSKIENQIEWLKKQTYYKDELKYVVELYTSLSNISINSVYQLEDISKKIDQLVNLTEKVYDQILRKVHRYDDASVLLDSISYIQHDYTTLSTEEKENIESLKKQLEKILTNPDFKVEDVENIANYLNSISTKSYVQHQTDPRKFVNGEPFMFVVHNLTSNTNIKKTDEFYRKNFISTSLITDKEMGLYGQNKVGFIYPVDANIIAADSRDIQSYNIDDDNSSLFIGKYDKPTIKPPTQIEQECMKQSIDETGEILNYSDKSKAYSEVVLDIRGRKPIGIFCITNGEKKLNIDYVNAMKLASEFNLPLVDIDMSLYRVKNSLGPIAENNKERSVAYMLYLYFKETTGKSTDLSDRLRIAKTYSEQIIDNLMTLKNNGQYSEEEMINILNVILSGIYNYSASEKIL